MRGIITFLALIAMLGVAAAAGGGASTQGSGSSEDSRTPQQRMNARFPQKVRVGDLIGLPILDYDDRTLGHVSDVARQGDGRIVLVMPERGWFGRVGRPVPIPIETVAILARYLNLLDIPRADVAKLPTWEPSNGSSIGRDEIIRIAIGRR